MIAFLSLIVYLPGAQHGTRARDYARTIIHRRGLSAKSRPARGAEGGGRVKARG
jgi:hypothetical protein